MANDKILAIFLLFTVILNVYLIQAQEVVPEDLTAADSASSRVKRGGGYGGGGGGGGGGHGHGPGRGGGAAGPVYFCGYVGKTEGSGYGYGK